MKLVLFVVSAVVIFCADSRDFPDKPDMGNFAVHHNQHIPSQQERKGEKELKLRGNAGKKNIKTLIKKLKNITVNLDSLKDGNTKLTKDNSDMKIENQAIKKSLDSLKVGNTKKTQDISQMKIEDQALKKSLDSLKDGNTKITQDISQMKIEDQAIKKSLDSLKDGNTKLAQDISQLKIEDQAIKKSLDSLKEGNTKLTQAISQMNTQLQAIQNRQGGVFIGGQYLTFSKENVTWDVAKTNCSSLNGRLAVLDDPQAFHAYANATYRGHYLWLGASDISREGTWTWINGKSLGSFPWGSGQPDNYGSNEDCLQWGWKDNYNDAPCTMAMRYVCEHGYN